MTSTTMRALIGGSGAPRLVEVPVPQAGRRQVRIRVAAAGVNPFDLAVAAGTLADYGVARRLDSYGLGFDVAGTVDQAGDGAGFLVGEEVIGLAARLELPVKAQAEYVVLDAEAVARAPRGFTAVQAATIPLNSLTAWQALDRAGGRPGRTLLVTGAAGAVGGYLVELAALRGVRVVALAGAGDEELIRGLGAEWFVARGEDVASAVREHVPGGVDAVVDAAVLGLAALDAVRDGGTFVALTAGVAPVGLRGIDVGTVFFRADAAQLGEAVRLVEAGRLTLRVAEEYPLEKAADAHARLAAGGIRGRLVLIP
ncbi:NADP-dependent oxidoreductase [Nonomuraea turcica]|uniref:NADP-dependent oxidoreductase n=1 Tax=Nonomuraea sp. G32 TaxID=3067274 RepID=UPI00273C8F4B|nr:NADP-dependent oxidoreductase [Nonomuraea sp. G32]MDP4503655.1 NADP-dependent oxidoreductase [Nonomuraea sp. G32]